MILTSTGDIDPTKYSEANSSVVLTSKYVCIDVGVSVLQALSTRKCILSFSENVCNIIIVYVYTNSYVCSCHMHSHYYHF